MPNTDTSSTSGLHKPVKSSSKKPADRQMSPVQVAELPPLLYSTHGQTIPRRAELGSTPPSTPGARAFSLPPAGPTDPFVLSKEKEGEFNPDLPQAQLRLTGADKALVRA